MASQDTLDLDHRVKSISRQGMIAIEAGNFVFNTVGCKTDLLAVFIFTGDKATNFNNVFRQQLSITLAEGIFGQ